MMNFFNTIILCLMLVLAIIPIFADAPESWQMTIQDPASPALEGMITFHEYLLFYLIQIGACVFWYLFFGKKNILKSSQFTHESFLEIFWTLAPAVILVFIAMPSFALLYSLDDVFNPELTLKVVGHQWYWSYEYNDYYEVGSDFGVMDLSFDSYLISTADLIEGAFRLLEVDNRVVLPINTHIRILICSADVLHSWAVPALGIKLDACPGRVSETSLFLKRTGIYYGQCSEICGVNHGLMPIVIQAVPAKTFFKWLEVRSSGVSSNSTF